MARAISKAEKDADDWVQRQRNMQTPVSATITINGQGNTGLIGVPVMVGGGVPVMIGGNAPIMVRRGGPRIMYRGTGMGRIVGLPFPPPNF